LKSLNKATNRGVCKTCDKDVYYSKKKLFSHSKVQVSDDEDIIWVATRKRPFHLTFNFLDAIEGLTDATQERIRLRYSH
jgi:hypothetical protein